MQKMQKIHDNIKETISKNKILSLAIPAAIENVLQTLVGFVDTLMISKIGLLAVTAVGVANTILNVYLAVFIALGIGTASLIAQKLGAEDKDGAQLVSNQSFLITLIVGGVFGIISIFWGGPLLSIMGDSDEVLVYAKQFFYIVGGASVFISLMTILGNILRATGDTKSPMKVSVFVNICNIVIDYILIFGFGPIPALGVVGTAIGTVISRFIGCILLIVKVQKSSAPINFKGLFKRSAYGPLIKLTVPATIERLVMRMGQVVYFGLIVSIGAKIFASHSIAGNIESFTYMPAYGLATAATTLIGNSIGAKNYAKTKEYAWNATKYGVIFMSILGGFLFFGAPFFASIFTEDVESIKQITTALRIDAFAQPALAISLILTGALQGMGDTKSPLYSTVVGMWGIRIIGVVVLSKELHLGIAGIWLAILVDLYLRSSFLIWMFNKNLAKYENNRTHFEK